MSSSNSAISIVLAAAGLVLVCYAMFVSEQTRDIYGRSMASYASPAPHAHPHFGGR
jgi:hypothetical protein